MIHRLGKEIDNPESVYYWAYKNDIPVFCPGMYRVWFVRVKRTGVKGNIDLR